MECGDSVHSDIYGHGYANLDGLGNITVPDAGYSYTEKLYYADGANPRYTGCPSAKINTLGGRYDYTFDAHNRLVKADYISGRPSEDFSTTYTYDAAGNPLTVKRYGVIAPASNGGEVFGVLDNLTYTYGDGNQVASISTEPEGIDFYGRTGYSLNDGRYVWSPAGNMLVDSSRRLTFFMYNYRAQPTQIRYKTGTQQNQYGAGGELLSTSTTTNNGMGLIRRYYSADRIFEDGKLLYSYFPGGYFDADGVAHFTHTDYQGSIIMVTDSDGKVVQHTSYYPYGEPHREPTGQPYLHGGKERLALTSDYHYGPRRYFSAALMWEQPDAHADNYTHHSAYSYCGGNPIGRMEIDGNDYYIFDNNGYIVHHSTTSDNDEIDVIGNHGSSSATFPLGTIEGHSSISIGITKDRPNITTGTVLKIRGDENGTKIFEMLADNTSVEYTNLKCGTAGNDALNFITSSHEKRTEAAAAQLVNNQLQYGYNVREHIHNHPSGNPVPGSRDKDTVKNLTEILKQSVSFKLYVSPGIYIPYTEDLKNDSNNYKEDQP